MGWVFGNCHGDNQLKMIILRQKTVLHNKYLPNPNHAIAQKSVSKGPPTYDQSETRFRIHMTSTIE